MKKVIYLSIALILTITMTSCSRPTSNAPVDTGVVIEYDSNLFMNIYDVRVSVDSSILGTQKQGEKQLYELTLTGGSHEIEFSEVGNDANVTIETFEVAEGEYYYFFIKAHTGSIAIEKKDSMSIDEALAITAESEPATSESDSPTPNDEANNDSDETVTEDPTSPSSTSDIVSEETLTIDNNEDMARLFTDGEEDYDFFRLFTEKYKGQTIEFDGNIANMTYHESYTTRYDMLIYAGDYSEVSSYGPSMQFSDVNMFDLHLPDDSPDYIGQGTNLHITAKVVEYTIGDLIILDPVSVSVR